MGSRVREAFSSATLLVLRGLVLTHGDLASTFRHAVHLLDSQGARHQRFSFSHPPSLLVRDLRVSRSVRHVPPSDLLRRLREDGKTVQGRHGVTVREFQG